MHIAYVCKTAVCFSSLFISCVARELFRLGNKMLHCSKKDMMYLNVKTKIKVISLEQYFSLFSGDTNK